MNNIKKFYRSKTNRIIFGVCGGLAEYFQVDPLLVRILFVLFILTVKFGIIAYFLLAIIIPVEGSDGGKHGRGKKAEESEVGKEIIDKGSDRNWFLEPGNIIGLIIILIGLDILFGQVFRFDPFAYVNWGTVWSLIIILIGLTIISKKY